MLHTPVCDRLGIAVCEAVGLGSLGTAARPTADLLRQWEGMRERTDRLFAVNSRPARCGSTTTGRRGSSPRTPWTR